MATQANPTPPDSGAVVDLWFRELLESVPVLRETVIHNRLHQAKEMLKQRLAMAAATEEQTHE